MEHLEEKSLYHTLQVQDLILLELVIQEHYCTYYEVNDQI